jgi:hypothetical protein
MATVNLGRIKPVFRGAYNNSTAYVIDDIVTSGNETFIAIAATQGNATSDASKWTKLAAKGADGTDVAATLANKEISFKTNAGALDGIPIGTAGQFLKVNSGATGYEFGAVSSDLVKLGSTTLGSNASYLSIDGFFNDTIYSHYKIEWAINVPSGSNSSACHLNFRFNAGGSPNTSTEYHGAFNHFGNNNGGGYNDIRQNSLANSWGKRNEFQISNTWNENEVKTYNVKNRGVMDIYEPQSTTHAKQFTYLNSIGTNNSSGGWTGGGMGHGIWQVPGTAATGVSFHMQGGQNIEAGSKLIMWGFKK